MRRRILKNQRSANYQNGYDKIKSILDHVIIPKGLNPEYYKNRIKYLEDELANAQADKEFVWSLWRQLQANNPDVTNAISSVIQREKEKNELRDTKILEILKIKDDKIKSLLESINLKDSECKNLKEKLKEKRSII